ncbi:hypothetical protein GALMADRAFT_800429 [Galerina marginata CBS 339.88]|uniref:Uncharacterized protein n=1 Tax=Galerina marginata (strain CBS 339.88) TaxID=685588 RepID=A0A067SMY5_GALM3|nr:hypothetical protein GALMADRAFT_800429 [Galerina marginata CBS 339.88]
MKASMPLSMDRSTRAVITVCHPASTAAAPSSLGAVLARQTSCFRTCSTQARHCVPSVLPHWPWIIPVRSLGGLKLAASAGLTLAASEQRRIRLGSRVTRSYHLWNLFHYHVGCGGSFGFSPQLPASLPLLDIVGILGWNPRGTIRLNIQLL